MSPIQDYSKHYWAAYLNSQEHQATLPPMSPEERERRVARLERLAELMDSRIALPGLPPIGLDMIIGLIPGIGDTLGLGVSGYIVLKAKQLGVPKATLLQMGLNIFIDWLIGIVPVLGDIFDWGWKANNRNAVLIRAHHEAHHKVTRREDMINVTPPANKQT